MTFFKELIGTEVSKNECITYKHKKIQNRNEIEPRLSKKKLQSQQTENPDDIFAKFTSRSWNRVQQIIKAVAILPAVL